MKLAMFSAGVMGAVLLSGCGGPESSEMSEGAGKLRVVASFLPIYAHTARVAGEGAEVRMLLRADSGPHDYQLTPEDVKRLAQADLFVINGAGIEAWLEDLVRAAGSARLKVVDTVAGIESIEGSADLEGVKFEREHTHAHGEAGHDCARCAGHGGGNPHIWLDPVVAMRQVRVIEAALAAADPGRAELFRANAAAYLAELEALDREFRETLEGLENKNLVTFHDAFPYLARRYGLRVVGYVEAFPEKEPSPREMKALVDAIGRERVGVVFAEVGYSPKVMRTLAQQTGARVAALDTLEVGEPAADAYLVRMRRNLAALREAWQP